MSNQNIQFNQLQPRPLLIVVSGPSGVGKDAVLQGLKNRCLPFHFVVTMTSRAPRPTEQDGVDYFFISRERFQELIACGEFIEYAMVYQDYKGVPKSQIVNALESGKDVVMRVDVQGAQTLKKIFPEALLIFLLPGDEEQWLKRLKGRNTETPEQLALRVDMVREELNTLPTFDYIVVNEQDKLDEAVDTILKIIDVEHHRVCRQKEIYHERA